MSPRFLLAGSARDRRVQGESGSGQVLGELLGINNVLLGNSEPLRSGQSLAAALRIRPTITGKLVQVGVAVPAHSVRSTASSSDSKRHHLPLLSGQCSWGLCSVRLGPIPSGRRRTLGGLPGAVIECSGAALEAQVR